MGGNATFPKRERLVSNKLMDLLFTGGWSKSTAAFPIRMVFMEIPKTEKNESIQVLMSVSKRHFKHAVDRNRVKRQLRETFRLNRQLLDPAIENHADRTLVIAFIWMTNRLQPTERVDSCMKKLLTHLTEKL